MIVTATDLKNNLGKYLRLCAREEIVVTSNGRCVAKLTAYGDAPAAASPVGLVAEKAEACADFPRKASYEEFLYLTENSEERYEYIDGQIYLLASPKTIHQKVLGELYILFHQWFRGKSCRPMLAPYDITLRRDPERINVVQPDLMVICDLEEKLDERDYYMGVPTLVLEILSEGTRGKDAVKKLDLYMSTGVREYWLVDPSAREVTVYFFERNDLSRHTAYRLGQSAISCVFPGLEVDLKQVFV